MSHSQKKLQNMDLEDSRQFCIEDQLPGITQASSVQDHRKALSIVSAPPNNAKAKSIPMKSNSKLRSQHEMKTPEKDPVLPPEYESYPAVQTINNELKSNESFDNHGEDRISKAQSPSVNLDKVNLKSLFWKILQRKSIENPNQSGSNRYRNILSGNLGTYSVADYYKKFASMINVTELELLSQSLIMLSLVLFITIITGLLAWPWGGSGECKPSDITCFGTKLFELYEEEIRPIEEETFFHDLVLPPLTKSHFINEKPIILLVGQYSSGKTTFLNLLLSDDYSGTSVYPGQFTSIAASTSEFTFVNGMPATMRARSSECKEEGSDLETQQEPATVEGECSNLDKVPDNSDGKYYVMNSHTPFNMYQYFSGTPVIKDMKAAYVNSTFLDDAYIIDTPGILTATKDSCDFAQFYDTLYFQSDLIIFMFDPYKPSDLHAAKDIFWSFKNRVNKVRFVINKADSLKFRDLLDVYGAIQYNLGRSGIFEALEINRFYLTSLWDKECQSNHTELCEIVEQDKNELIQEIEALKNNRYKIESKIKSLSERIEMIKKHIINLEAFAAFQCDCGFVSCDCEEPEEQYNEDVSNQIIPRTSQLNMDHKLHVCYHKATKDVLFALEREQKWSAIGNLQHLHSEYGPKISQLYTKLNSIAEKLENSLAG